jgi:GNAT superfamily N-acetyltransferase
VTTRRTKEDFPHWLPLWKGYQVFYEASIPEQVTEVTWQRILDPSEPINGALAWKDGKAIGLVHWIFHRSTWTIANSCYLQDLFVHTDARGHGVGRKLIELVYQKAAEEGCAKVHWLTHETNATAQHLYNSVGERSGFIQFRHLMK